MNTKARVLQILLACALVLGSVGVATAQLAVEWVARSNSPANGSDSGTAIGAGLWQDVDTPEMFEHAEQVVSRRQDSQ